MLLKHEPVKIVMRQYSRPKIDLKTTIIRNLWGAVAVVSLGSFLWGVWYLGQQST